MTPFDRLFRLMTKPGIFISYFVLIIVSYLYFDQPVAIYFHAQAQRSAMHVLGMITHVGLGVVYLPAFFILAVFFRFIRPNTLWEARFTFLFLCVGLAGTICGLIKVTLGRARPNMWFDGHYYGFYWLQTQANFWSMPSGHTTTLISAALGLGIVFPRYFYLFLIAGLSLAFSRVILVHHYLSDVLTAAYLTLLIIAGLRYCLSRKGWLAQAWKTDV